MRAGLGWRLLAAGLALAAPSLAATAAAQMQGPAEADVRFVQAMIEHHAQALEMTALVPERSETPEIRLLARRIELSQADEIALLERWLEACGQTPARRDHAADHGHHAAHDPDHDPDHDHGDAHPAAHGMLSGAEMASLEAARGARFDRLFLELMIHHHEGALVMVAELLAVDGAAQAAEIFQFASHVEGDQRVEIARMQRMLEGLP